MRVQRGCVIGVMIGMCAASLIGCAGGSGAARTRVSGGDTAATRPTTPGRGTAVPNRSAIYLYNAGDYAAAKKAAEAEIRRSTGAARDRAALIAGMAAAALKDGAGTELYLRPLTRNPDREISGRAGAALGIRALEEKRYDAAAELLTIASRRLTGNEAAKAAMFAGDAMAARGRRDSARSQYVVASGMATDPLLKKMIGDRLEQGEYAIQMGVFSVRSNAERAAAEANAKAAAFGVGTARIVQRTEAEGKPVWVVQLGRFPSRQQAADARARLGEGGLVAVLPGE